MHKSGRKIGPAMVAIILNIVMVVGLGIFGYFATISLSRINGRILYLQDSIRILQSDLTNMKDEIRTTMEKENSLLEDHSFELVDMNFKENTYTVNITVIPKDYTKTTEASIFFGVNQYKLEQGDFYYTGTAELPFDNSFAGNVAVLLEDGEKRNTEVLHDYDGYVNDFGSMLKATALSLPTVKDGKVTANGPARFEMDGKDRFRYVQCNMWVEVDGTKVFGRDYLKYREENENAEVILDYSQEGDGLEVPDHVPVESLTAADGAKLVFEAKENQKIRIYMEAVTADGYRFTYDVFRGTINEKGDGFTEESVSTSSEAAMYDRYGNQKKFR